MSIKKGAGDASQTNKFGEEREIVERCHVTELWNQPTDRSLSVARCRVKPGITTQLHKLGVDERYLVEAGQGIMEVGGGATFRAKPSDAIFIPAGVSQRIRNDGGQDLIFLAVCSPAFGMDSYHDLEQGVIPPPPELPQQ